MRPTTTANTPCICPIWWPDCKPLWYDDFDVNRVTEVGLKPNAKQNELSAAIFIGHVPSLTLTRSLLMVDRKYQTFALRPTRKVNPGSLVSLYSTRSTGVFSLAIALSVR